MSANSCGSFLRKLQEALDFLPRSVNRLSPEVSLAQWHNILAVCSYRLVSLFLAPTVAAAKAMSGHTRRI